MMTPSKVRFLFLMGGSGCGKTTLAKKLEQFAPEKFYRNIEYGTREKRPGEIDGFDYMFIDDDELLRLNSSNELFESVVYQFPDMYGCNNSEIKEDRINVTIVCMEGFLSAARKLKRKYPEAECILVNILNDCELDIQREGRDPLQEERFNKAVIMNMPGHFSENGDGTITGKFSNIYWVNDIRYHEMNLSKLKTIRNSPRECVEYFYELFSKK